MLLVSISTYDISDQTPAVCCPRHLQHSCAGVVWGGGGPFGDFSWICGIEVSYKDQSPFIITSLVLLTPLHFFLDMSIWIPLAFNFFSIEMILVEFFFIEMILIQSFFFSSNESRSS